MRSEQTTDFRFLKEAQPGKLRAALETLVKEDDEQANYGNDTENNEKYSKGSHLAD